MLKERRELPQPSAVQKLWEITKPEDDQEADVYFDHLETLIPIRQDLWFWVPFDRQKKSGGKRQIVPAAAPLGYIQHQLANWIFHNLSQGEDYCYTGRNVKSAVEPHIDKPYALVCDLQNAFDHATRAKIAHWLPLYDKRFRDEKVLNLMLDLLTFEGRAPQGCATTPYVFNMIVAQMDRHMDLVARPLGIESITRYSDNICFSAKSEFDAKELEAQVRRVATSFGFPLSWVKSYEGSVDYLGVTIQDGTVRIEDERAGEFLNRIYQMIESGDPRQHYKSVLGIQSWMRQIYGPNIPKDIARVLNIYFRLVDKPPIPLEELWDKPTVG